MKVFAEDYISPELVKVTTPRYRPLEHGFDPGLGTYTYSVNWEGIPAASCSATVRRVNGKLLVETTARTYSGIDLLYKLRYAANVALDGQDFTPSRLEIDHRENSQIKSFEIDFNQETGEIRSARGRGPDDTEKKTLSFTPRNFTLDPIAAVLIARSLDWKVGDSRTFDVFNGKSRYFITLTAVEKTEIEQGGKRRSVFAIVPRVRNLTATKAVDKLREAKIYVSADERRDILRIVSSVFIGSITTELDSFVSADTHTEDLALSRRASSAADHQTR
jgi:hypothetical protein